MDVFLPLSCEHIAALCFARSSEVNQNYGRVFLDVRKQYLKLLHALVSEHTCSLKIPNNTVLWCPRLHSKF